ncbi:MAG: Carbohydrate binding family 6, partial [Promethearchaeota archaeon CR_4]
MIPGNTYTWIDAVTGGTQLSLGDDGYSAQSLPFSFTYYDASYTTIYVSANGWLSFANTAPSAYSNQPYPILSSTYAYAMAPFWDDLYPGNSGNQVYVKSGANYWVMAWINVLTYSGSMVGTFEVVLYETGEIVFNYDYLDYTGGGYTCGLNLGLDINYYNSYTGLSAATEDFSILFSSPIAPPLNP